MSNGIDARATTTESGRDHMTRLVRGCVMVLLAVVIVFSRTIAVAGAGRGAAVHRTVSRRQQCARMGVPRALASILVLLAMVGTSGGIIYSVREPLTQLAARGPQLAEIWQQLLTHVTGRSAASVGGRQGRSRDAGGCAGAGGGAPDRIAGGHRHGPHPQPFHPDLRHRCGPRGAHRRARAARPTQLAAGVRLDPQARGALPATGDRHQRDLRPVNRSGVCRCWG